MEKVKLTPEQAEAVKIFCKTYNQQYWLEIFKNNKQIPDWEHEEMRVLTELSDEEFALAVCGWYEIEVLFKVGDWVVLLGDICEIIRFQCDTPMKDDGRCYLTLKRLPDGIEYYNIPREHVRLATHEEIAAEKERRKWVAIGRKHGEFKKGDIVMFKGYADIVEFVNLQHGPYLKGLKRYVDLNEIELICPVEQRFDVKEDNDESA
jgi:hypothetical protein